MTNTTPTRRQQLRLDTTAEIKRVALELLAEGGPDAISLRAIAREMRMTAGALYSYYATRDELITALTADMYTSLVDKAEAARDAHPADEPGARLRAWGEAFRAWAVADPAGFKLVYGDPVRGYKVPEGGAAPEAASRACAGLTGLVAAAWPVKSQGPEDEYTWDDFDPGLADLVRTKFPELPPAAVALALRVWGRMHGLVALEVYGHLRAQTKDPARLYRAELRDLARSLGLED
ncbi:MULTISPECIES: TetR/AcrR family transcriptional regulator [Glycomyces]|uniref:AcrR family transcriptional regulator n=1 Tax=Glycomyces lechevalierae TaxID=256034 RepID=A0A9X3PRZ2_9ACTN|nr:TetR/AcrR family transcriptional regulator [Glycomyces lechevalierae]MDA1388252.1 TetR/AcrR family transcriptional regulator [Glycomyces lechevalierae]MDR7337306.1 AcrR family transcriptional regulator [Glycomyces lechevalierae]